MPNPRQRRYLEANRGPASPGSLLIEKQAIYKGNTSVITSGKFNTHYTNYKWIVYFQTAAANSAPQLVFSGDNGGTYSTSNYAKTTSLASGDMTTGLANLRLNSVDNIDSNAGQTVVLIVEFHNPLSDQTKWGSYRLYRHRNTGSTPGIEVGDWAWASTGNTNTITSVKFTLESGIAFSGGYAELYATPVNSAYTTVDTIMHLP